MEDNYVPSDDESVDDGGRRPRRASADVALRRIVSPPKTAQFSAKLAKQIVEFAKRNRPRALTCEEKLDTLLLQRHFRLEHQETVRKTPLERRKRKAPDYTKKVSNILFRDNKLVAATWKEFVTRKKIKTSKAPGNHTRKPKYVPDTRKVLSTLQKFMRQRREKRQRTVAKDILDCLVDNELVPGFDRTNRQRRRAALRAVQRYCRRKGFQRGKKKRLQILPLEGAQLTCTRRVHRPNDQGVSEEEAKGCLHGRELLSQELLSPRRLPI